MNASVDPVDSSGADSPKIAVRTASDGYRLHYRHWKVRSGPPRGWLLVLHGIQSHSGWYESSGNRFAQAGWDVRMPDRRGSGLNRAARGDVCHWQRLRQDLRHFLFDMEQERQRWHAPGPVLIAGISWGGKLALQLAREASSRIDGVSLITPGLFSRFQPRLFDRCRIRLARITGINNRKVPIPLNDPALFTSDPQRQQFIRNDPLALHEMTLSLLYASQDLDRIALRPEKVPVPLQLMLAEEDRIIDNERIETFLRSCAGSEFQSRTYTGAAHTLEFEKCREQFVQDWLNWAEQIRPIGSDVAFRKSEAPCRINNHSDGQH